MNYKSAAILSVITLFVGTWFGYQFGLVVASGIGAEQACRNMPITFLLCPEE